jgi:RimK family alpha-L-glutamate ligase
LEKFKSFITEAKEEPYKLVILSHDDPLDPNETGPMVRKKSIELGIDVYLAEFTGMYMEDKGKDQLIYSFPVDEDGKAELPGIKDDIEYEKPFRMNPKDTLVMARGIGSTIKSGNLSWRTACLNLEHQGYTIINSVRCNDICNDKWYNQIIFQQNDIRTPTTVLVRHSEGAEEAVERLGNKFPMILKTAVGSRGVGVIWIESLKSLHSIIQLLYREDKFVDVLLQEYIKTDYDVRVIIAAGQILGAIKRPVIASDFRSNVSQGSEPESHELTEHEVQESLRAAEAVDGSIVGVDFIPAKNRDKESPYFIEVNSTPGLMGIEAVLSKSAVKPLIKGKNRSITKEILKLYMNRDNWNLDK